MTDARRRTGQIAEELVAGRLRAAGWEILDRRVRDPEDMMVMAARIPA